MRGGRGFGLSGLNHLCFHVFSAHTAMVFWKKSDPLQTFGDPKGAILKDPLLGQLTLSCFMVYKR